MMNDLLQTHALLAAGLRADPLLALASVVCWLDPLWGDEEDEWDVPQDEDGTLAVALRVTRQAFPDVYAQAVEAVRRGASYAELDRLICGAITARGIPLDDLEWIGFGIPMPAYGVVLDDPDFYTAHPDTIPVLQCFGITREPNPYHVDVPDCAYTAGKLIAADLHEHADTCYRQVAWLLGWLFSCTGNSSIDYSDEEHSEFQPLSWDADDLAFAVEIIQEAETILADALAGLAFLNRRPDLLPALQHNVQRIYKAIEKTKGKPHEPHIRLAWPHLAGSPE
ncbi:MAG: hypothetical protein K8I60_13345 [Anaerolineae bacterium]|nr:hypothetical protein [Anaerolineae bacterium]